MNNKGFSLLEILIALVIGTAAVGGLSTLLVNTLKASKNIEAKNEFNSLVQSMELVLKDQSLCSFSLLNNRKSPDPILAKFAPDKTIEKQDLLSKIKLHETVIVELGYIYSSFSVSQLHLSEVDKTKRRIISPAKTQYLANLHLEGARIGGGLQNSQLKHDFLLWVTTNADVIETCRMQADSGSASGAFMADMGGKDQLIPSSIYTKVIFSNKVRDEANEFNNAASSYKPSVPGYYLISGQVGCDTKPYPVGSCGCNAHLYKNGTLYKTLGAQVQQVAWNWHLLNFSALEFANGSTDYYEIYAYQNCSAAIPVTGSSNSTWLSAILVK